MFFLSELILCRKDKDLTPVYGPCFFTGNGLETIQSGSFKDASTMTILHLFKNKLKKLSAGMLEGLGKLERLLLNENEIEKIEDGALAGFSSLSPLNLEKNKISSLPWSAFVPVPGTTNLVASQPSNISLDIAKNNMQCTEAECWMKWGEEDGWLKWEKNGQPACDNHPGKDWADIDLNCTKKGK